ncbi:MAG: PEP-CTERM sorting domain-containing protein [Opitutales bacterium]
MKNKATYQKKTIYFLATAVLTAASSAKAQLVSGSGANDDLGDAQTWGGSDSTKSPIMVDLRFDFNASAAASNDFLWLWEFGAGVGSSLTINDESLYLASDGGSGGGGSHFTSGAHGLDPGTTGIQVLSVIDVDNDILEIYVNGVSIARNESYGANDWAGTDGSFLAPPSGGGGDEPSDTMAYPGAADANFSIDVYLLGDGSNGTTQLGDVLVTIPEPSIIVLLFGIFGFCGVLHRRYS